MVAHHAEEDRCSEEAKSRESERELNEEMMCVCVCVYTG